jgi:ABC-type sulfate transport system permease component
MKELSFDLIFSFITGLFVLVILLPMIALFGTISMGELIAQLRSASVLSAIAVSLETSVLVVTKPSTSGGGPG